jgi:hypothetical protein
MPLAYGLIHPTELPLPQLPLSLEGLRIAHFSDLHIWRPSRRYDRLIRQITSIRIDLAVFTGDYIFDESREDVGIEIMHRLFDRLHPPLGSFGVFGNHDSPAFCDAAQSLPIHWLTNRAHRLPDKPIELLGLDASKHQPADSVALALDEASLPTNGHHAPKPLRLLLCHHAGYVNTAADLGAQLMFAGHTHGGQIRLPTGHALINSSDLPLPLTSGILRHRNTLVAVSRGIGDGPFRPRLFCPPHLPIYTLRRRSLPGKFTHLIENLRPW